jgi:hypothetical protein
LGVLADEVSFWSGPTVWAQFSVAGGRLALGPFQQAMQGLLLFVNVAVVPRQISQGASFVEIIQLLLVFECIHRRKKPSYS